jgi:isopropylmalate/homocitrate/citramalate synthase
LCNEGGIGALKELSLLVESLSGVKIAKNKPVVGEENFARE